MPASPAEAAPPPARARHVGRRRTDRSARMSRWLEVVTVACLSVTSSGAASTTPSTSSRPLLATELPPISLEPAESLGNRAPWRGADGGGRALRVCTTGDYPPLTSYDPSTEEFSGLAPSILRQFGSMYNYSITFVLTTWDAMHADLTNGTRCDLAAGGIDTEDRRSRFGVSVPVLTYKKVPLFSKENEAVFQTLDDINRTGVTILECEGSANEVFVRELRPACPKFPMRGAVGVSDCAVAPQARARCALARAYGGAGAGASRAPFPPMWGDVDVVPTNSARLRHPQRRFACPSSAGVA